MTNVIKFPNQTAVIQNAAVSGVDRQFQLREKYKQGIRNLDNVVAKIKAEPKIRFNYNTGFYDIHYNGEIIKVCLTRGFARAYLEEKFYGNK